MFWLSQYFHLLMLHGTLHKKISTLMCKFEPLYNIWRLPCIHRFCHPNPTHNPKLGRVFPSLMERSEWINMFTQGAQYLPMVPAQRAHGILSRTSCKLLEFVRQPSLFQLGHVTHIPLRTRDAMTSGTVSEKHANFFLFPKKRQFFLL